MSELSYWKPQHLGDIEENKKSYNMLLHDVMMRRAETAGIEVSMEKLASIDNVVTKMLSWLDSTDFYTAPASMKYHEAFPGGLLLHTLKVYNKIIELMTLPTFKSIVNPDSAILVALTHDWCKINKYEQYMKNVKDPDTGEWSMQSAYKPSETYMGLGHGPQSLMMVTQFCNSKYTRLSFDEMAAIRWHMYTYDITSYDMEDLNRCNNNIPLVHLIQFADQLAIVNYS
jgi:hypothetical protein